MGNDTSNDTNENDYIWEPNRKSASGLPDSDHAMDDKRKEMIRKALEYNIIDVRSYAGYKGDNLVEFTTLDHDTALSLKNIAKSLGLDVVVRQNPLMVFQIFCIVATSDDIYDLKA